VTKEELIKAIAKKVQKAHPMVKRVFLPGLKYKTKPELARILSKARVTDGDIRL